MYSVNGILQSIRGASHLSARPRPIDPIERLAVPRPWRAVLPAAFHSPRGPGLGNASSKVVPQNRVADPRVSNRVPAIIMGLVVPFLLLLIALNEKSLGKRKRRDEEAKVNLTPVQKGQILDWTKKP